MRQDQQKILNTAGIGFIGRAAIILALGMALPVTSLMAQDQTAAPGPDTAPAADAAPAADNSTANADNSTANAQDAATSPDAQTDANVLTALGTSKDLANVAITTNTVNGVVTLTGVVRDENQKELAESLTAHAAGVTSVVNNLTIKAEPAEDATTPATLPQTAVMQTDGSDAAQPQPDQAQPDQNQPDQTAQTQPDQSQQPGASDNTNAQVADDNSQSAAPPPGQSSVAGGPPDQANAGPNDNGAPDNGQADNGAPNGPPQDGQQYGPQNGPPQDGQQYGPQNGPPNGGGYPYGRRYERRGPPLPPQVAGKQVTIPAGTVLRIRTMQPLDVHDTKVGATFSAVVLNDVIADDAVAIPRGAIVQGTVMEAKKAGAFGGTGRMAITLNTISVGGQGYTVTTDAWSNHGPNKTGETVYNTIGMGALGAFIGAAAGGGPGAAIGAAAGGTTGFAVSGAEPSRQAYIPAEAVLLFHLQQPLGVTTISQEDLDRLAGSVGPPQGGQPRFMRRGYYGGYGGYPGGYPPPPPAYYGYPY